MWGHSKAQKEHKLPIQGGTESAGAMSSRKTTTHWEVPAQCTSRGWKLDSRLPALAVIPGPSSWFKQHSYLPPRKLGNEAPGVTERLKTALFPHCPGTNEASQIFVRPWEGGHFIPTPQDEEDQISLQPSHVGIQNSIYFDLKEIKGSFISFTWGSMD